MEAHIGVMSPTRDRYTGRYEIFFEWDDGRVDSERLAASRSALSDRSGTALGNER